MTERSTPRTIQVPREVFSQMVRALRAAAKDARRDRVLHDETIELLEPADESVRTFLDKRSGVG